MTVLPFPEYAPDVATLQQDASPTINNVLPQKNGYGPVPSPSVYSASLPAACRGFFRSRNSDGSITVFAATSTRLWKLNNTDFTWIPISKVIALTSISNATPAVFTLVAHGLSIGDAIVLSTSSGLPTGLVVGTVYYVIAAGFTANAFEVSTTAGGTAVNTSSAGAGTHSFTGYYTAVPTADQWQFAQFNNLIFATQINTPLQVLDLTAPTAFTTSAGSPPQSRYISVVNRFLVLSGMSSSTPYRIQWSGLNATTTWTQGVNSSDFQDLPDGGIVRGVAGGEYGTIMQDASIRRMIYAPGTTYIFQIERITQDQGIYAPLSLIRAGDILFYCGSDGFRKIVPGGSPQNIGKERVDRTFFADVDNANLQFFIGASEPRSTRVYWAYKSIAGNASLFDKVLIYDYALDRWALATGISGEYLCDLARPGLTLENLDSINSSIDALTFSLDDVSTNAIEFIAAFDSSHRLNFITGTPLEATLDTAEQEADGWKRLRVQGMRPVTDAATVYGNVYFRETTQQSFSSSTEQGVTAVGVCPANVSARLVKGRVRIPAGTAWTYASGIEPMSKQEGTR